MKHTPIYARVSPETISKVSRLFNGSLTDIINELLQNARRAQAATIAVTTTHEDDGLRITISDNGTGIADPSAIVHLGSSGWDEGIADYEDPAGMGFFSLAGLKTTVISRHKSEVQAWRAIIGKTAWTGEAPILVENYHRAVGTTVSFLMPAIDEHHVENVVTTAAKHFPLNVTLNGNPKPQVGFIEGALHKTEWCGSTIGVFKNRNYDCHPTLNFHGVTIRERLFSLTDTEGRAFHAKLDIGATPALQLVLPARKELVQNDALDQLRHTCERAIYEHIATLDEHALSFEQWERAGHLGIKLGEAKAELYAWEPDTADGDDYYLGDKVNIDGEHILCEAYEPQFDQAMHRALDGRPLRKRLVATKPAYEGYPWYDTLRSLRNPRFEAQINGVDYTIDCLASDHEISESGEAQKLAFTYAIADPTGVERARESVSADIVALHKEGSWSDGLHDMVIVFCKGGALTPEVMVDYLDAACFSASRDSDTDCWDTQHDRFLRDAREEAHLLLEGEDAAIASVFRDTVARVLWQLPKEKSVTIACRNGSPIEVTVCDTPAHCDEGTVV